MTIKERQEREAHDRENPWRPMGAAPRGTGLICDLLFDDMVGHFATEGLQYFLDVDDRWYQIEPPRRIYEQPMNWRPSYVRMKSELRRIVKQRSNAHENR
ncbi:hypothetical protein CO668_08685 [Rhizobium anhuiense]|uniref:hypothetical protein n=1 Tax=Rhizobium anhuiense TaxID=1184720 RepID=UPI000BE8500D|nr:hypothetical protein [Rhizobium anhuiense]PDS45381.1 hypothetical protein CO668_08685 [Rhizobium anhuiense]